MTPRASGTTRVGPDGPNEDALAVDDECRLYAVADGVGRYRGAAVASALAIDAVREALAGGPPAAGGAEAVRGWLGRAAGRAARVLHARGRADTTLASMATTLTVLQLVGESWWTLHVGDTRAYLLRDGRLEQLTRDHSLAWEQLEAGAITKEQLRTHPNQNLLMRSLLAQRDSVVPELRTGDARPGDRFLLCSDGLGKALAEEQVAALLAGGDDPEQVARALVERAAEAGLKDDTTVVVIFAPS